MQKDIRKTKKEATPFIEVLLSQKLTKSEQAEFHSAVLTWGDLVTWLRQQTSSAKVLKCLSFECTTHVRPLVVDRIRTKYNKLRGEEELNELEQYLGQVININVSRLERRETNNAV